ncbi:hypothetical protein [Beijerinckia sp. L45]|uniref:hypothetical protein n=1 Tax=Beijerinckia sp. L45 TaxID=1641855 RepID=UPI00131C28D0|nr:hypothetical protein [Beijerinckia sp. L45]
MVVTRRAIRAAYILVATLLLSPSAQGYTFAELSRIWWEPHGYAEIVISALRKRYPGVTAMRVSEILSQTDHTICMKIAFSPDWQHEQAICLSPYSGSTF